MSSWTLKRSGKPIKNDWESSESLAVSSISPLIREVAPNTQLVPQVVLREDPLLILDRFSIIFSHP